MLVRVLRLLFVLSLCALPAALPGQVKASLQALKSRFPADAKEVVVGLRLEHEAKWHTYWLQPGTGLPTSLDWQLPTGWTAGPIRWPAPHRVYDTAGNLAGNGYEGIVFLPIVLTPPRGLAADIPVTLRAKAEWLMCKDVCIPGDAELSLTLIPSAPGTITTANATDSVEGEALLTTLETLPKPLPVNSTAHVTRTDSAAKGLQLQISGLVPPPSGEPWYFDAHAVIAYDKPQPLNANALDGQLALELAVSDYAEPAPARLTGLLTFAGGPAYEIDLPITNSAPASSSGLKTDAPSLPPLLLLAFAGGLVLNLMPCVFPVLGLKVMGFVQQAGQDRKKITTHGLVFTGGVLLSFWLLAGALAALRAGGSELGWGFQLQEPGFVFAMATVLLAFALNMSGVFEFALGATAVGGALQQKDGYAGSFFTGVLATIVATPCSAPFL
ncbi:MAG: hypothetical protein RLZZ50_515, partial [Verrucomicrobiota bacterium]